MKGGRRHDRSDQEGIRRSTRLGVGRKRWVSVLVAGLLFLLGMVAVLATSSTVAVSTLSNWSPGPKELRIRGADISFTLQEEAMGRTVTDNGEALPIEQILARHGANYARLRVWVNPPAGTSDLGAALTLAARTHDAGMKLVLDLHFSDTWADRRSQQTPAGWANLGTDALQATVESYTRDTVAAFARQGTPVDIVQIGNEVTRGFLWPAGQIYRNGGEHWAEFTDLLKAGIKGAKEVDPARPPAIMIHIDTGGDTDASAYFFDHLQQHGVAFDLIGLSYYPFWNGSLADLSRNLDNLASRYGKDIVIAETAYPWTLASGEDGPTVVNDMLALPDAALYRPTPQGQEMFFQALGKLLRQVRGGHGAGFFVWEPGWLPGVAANADVGDIHNNLTLFDWWGRGLPALDAFYPTVPPGG
jgi:arabinogalactan endo-1,4-beta-galactosidase